MPAGGNGTREEGRTSRRERTAAGERERLAYRLLPGETRFALERDGAVISWSKYPAAGTAKGTIVLVHGVASNGSRWEEFAETSGLHEDWDIVRLDQRGHGASPCRGRAKLQDWCADLGAVMTEAGAQKAVIMGHSLGAHVAMKFASENPDRVSGLILLDPLVTEALTKEALKRKRQVTPMLHVTEETARAMNILGFHRRIVKQDLRAMDEAARVKIAHGGEELQAFVKEYSSATYDLKYIHMPAYTRDLLEAGRKSPAPSKLLCPVLVISAKNGAWTDSARMREWTEELVSGEIRTVDCVHWPLTECMEEVSSHTRNWLAKTFPRRDS